MRTVFSHSEDALKFSKEGFLRKKLLGEPQIIALTELYNHYFRGGTQDFFSSTYIENVELKREIDKKLTEIILPSIGQYFTDFKILGAQFLVKNPGQKGGMPFHQDWTVVDESEYRSLTVWMGLSEISEENGAIKVVPGSHEFSRGIRSPGNFDKLTDLQDLLEKHSHTLIMRAGEAFIFDHSLIHGSGQNTSSSPRVAVALGLVHKDAELMYYHKNKGDCFEKYRVKEDFFITFPNKGERPEEAELVDTFSYTFEKTKPGEFISAMHDLKKTDTHTLQVQPLFRNADLQEKFEKDGFVKIALLNETEAAELKSFYHSLHHDHIGNYGFHISLENKSQQYINTVFKKLFDTILPRLDPVLVNYKAFTASYVIKEAGLQNIVPPHQDWTFVNENEFCSATVWVPLMDVTKSNGALGLIKGSHRVFTYPRSSPSPEAKSLLSDHAFNLFPYIEVIEMKAGEALIFNNRTIHASPPNTSGVTRIAAGIGITQKNAQLRHYYQLPGKEEKIAVYSVDESFFPVYNNSTLSALFNKGEKPSNLELIETFHKNIPVLSKEEITGMVSSINGVKKNMELMTELAGLYNYNLDGTPKNDRAQSSAANEKPTEPETPLTSENNSKEPALTENTHDNRTFFQKYTPSNILAEIKYRLTKN